MRRITWKGRLQLLIAAGLLITTCGCVSTFAPLALSLGESVLLTQLFGTGN